MTHQTAADLLVLHGDVAHASCLESIHAVASELTGRERTAADGA